MNQIARGMAEANFHRPGIGALHLGVLDGAFFQQLKEEARVAVEGERVTTSTSAGWTRPFGDVREWSMFNASGRTSDYTTDFRRRIKGQWIEKRANGGPAFQRLCASIPGLLNMRILCQAPGGGLSPHESYIVRKVSAGKVGLRPRFQLPLETNPEARMMVGGLTMHFEEGHLYFLNVGAVHNAWNAGSTDRYHLVFDAYLTERNYRVMFGDDPPDWLRRELSSVRVIESMQIEDFERQPGKMTYREYLRHELVFFPR